MAFSGEDALSNADLAPTPLSRRTWGLWNFAALWIGISVCIPTYMLAATMIASGLNWWQSLFIIVLGNAIVLVPMLITGHAGTRYGIPFPVLARASYGMRGAHLPGLLRSLVACGWFGIQTWVGGLAISALAAALWPAWKNLGGGARFMGHGLPEFTGFFVFWLMNLYFVWAGTNSIKWLEAVSAPFEIFTGVALLWWATSEVGGVGVALAASDRLVGTPSAGGASFFVTVFLPWLTAMVGYWATLAINIPDFTRFARGQRQQAVGQTLGLLTTMPLFAFIGVAVTGATLVMWGEAVWNPIHVLSRLTEESGSRILGIMALIALPIATLTTNIAANVVSPANAFSNLAPARVSARMGGLVAASLGVLIFPWLLLDRYQDWLISYSGILGAVGGVIVADYVAVRRGRLDLAALYDRTGAYAYRGGVNHAAIVATAVGAGAALLGKLVPALAVLYNASWFTAGGVACAVYLALSRKRGMKE